MRLLILLLFFLLVVVMAIVLAHDIFVGRWDLACFSLAITWACWEVGRALARVVR